MSANKLLIIEDDEDLRTQMKWALARDYEVLLAEDRRSAMTLIHKDKPAVLTLDLGLPPNPAGVDEGFALLEEMLDAEPHTKVIIVTGRGEKEHALHAVEKGAYDFFYKPIELDELKVVLRRAYHLSRLEDEQRSLRRQLAQTAFEGMLGTCPGMQEVFTIIRKVAGTDAPVLITGESGTGKELVARAIHSKSLRSARPFIVINCSAIPETLLESELFGHEKGAFTGAHRQRLGRFEMAEGGTLFLDEIGELPATLQVKLLRFLQDRCIERVGGREQIEVDTRVIAATNRDLNEAMAEGAFREDLYYRLGVISVSLPPLRERKGDALVLAKAFLERFSTDSRKKIRGFTLQAMQALEDYRWPGNVRELENRVKRAVIMAEEARIIPEDLELEQPREHHETMSLKEARETLEREMITRAIARMDGNLTKAATELGISRPTLYDLMDKFGFSKH